jgi:hypothetical protein
MSPGASDVSSYDVIGSSADPTAPVVSVRKRSANTFDVFTVNTRGEPADAVEFSVKVYHKS